MSILSVPPIAFSIPLNLVNQLNLLEYPTLESNADAIIDGFTEKLAPVDYASKHSNLKTCYKGTALNEWRVTLVEMQDDTDFAALANLTFVSEENYVKIHELEASVLSSPGEPPKKQEYSSPIQCIDRGFILNRINRAARIGFLHNHPLKLNVHYSYTNYPFSTFDRYTVQYSVDASKETSKISVNRFLLSGMLAISTLSRTPLPRSCCVM